jgi:TRAP-type transport system small permease protein
MDTSLRAIRGVNRGLHYVSGALITLMMLFTVYNILGRWLFGAPLGGTVELTQLSMIGIVYLGFAYAQHNDDHISVDLLYVRFGKRGQAVLDAVAAVISFAVLVLLAWRLYDYSQVLELSGRTTATRRIPLYPLAYVAIVGTIAFVLALFATVIERARDARAASQGASGTERED